MNSEHEKKKKNKNVKENLRKQPDGHRDLIL